MKTYKIVNISNFLDKKNVNYNKDVIIEYIDGITKKSVLLKPNNVLYIKTLSLSLSTYKQKMKNLISISEIDENEVDRIIMSINKKQEASKNKNIDLYENENEQTLTPAKKSSKNKTTKRIR